MAIKIISTLNYSLNGVKALVSSPAGMGKTVLCSTAPSPLIISAEAGLLSLQDVDVPAIEVTSAEEVLEVYEWASSSEEANQYSTLCLDSISEIGEVMLSQYKEDFKDPRAAYGELNDTMAGLIRAFRDIKGKNVYFTAKEKMVQEDNDITKIKATMPGNTLLHALPYFFDIVLTLKLGKLEDGTLYRYLQCAKDFKHADIKDRSGKLDEVEPPDLTYLIKKISGQPVGEDEQAPEIAEEVETPEEAYESDDENEPKTEQE